jgi:hypothetical protein
MKLKILAMFAGIVLIPLVTVVSWPGRAQSAATPMQVPLGEAGTIGTGAGGTFGAGGNTGGAGTVGTGGSTGSAGSTGSGGTEGGGGTTGGTEGGITGSGGGSGVGSFGTYTGPTS